MIETDDRLDDVVKRLSNQDRRFYKKISNEIHDCKIELECKIEDLRDDVSILKEDNRELKQDVSVLKKDVGELKSDVSVLKKDVNELKSDVEVLKVGQNELKQDVSGLKQDMTGLKQDVKKIDEKFDQLIGLLSRTNQIQ